MPKHFHKYFWNPECFTKYKSIVTEKEKTHKNVRSLIKILIKLRNSRSISTPLLKHTYHQIKVFWKLRILHKTNVPEVKERSSQPFLSQKTSIFKLQSNIFFLFFRDKYFSRFQNCSGLSLNIFQQFMLHTVVNFGPFGPKVAVQKHQNFPS